MKAVLALTLFAGLAPSLALAAADVTPTALAAPKLAFAGMPFTATVTVQNRGDVDALAFSIGFYLTVDHNVTQLGKKLAQVDGVTVAAGKSADVPVTISLPFDLTTGPYFLGAICDPANVLREVRSDKTIGVPLQVQVPLPDFVARLVEAPTAADAGEAIPIHRVIENVGNHGGATSYTLYLSTNAQLTTSDLAIFTGTVTLEPGTTDDRVDTVTLPEALAVGTYYVGLLVNADQKTHELSLDNDAALGGQLAVGPPALAIETTYVPDSIVGLPYTRHLVASGGEAALTWSAKGDLPPGLALSTGGVLSGTATAPAATAPIVTVTSGRRSASLALVVRAFAASVPLEVATTSLPPASEHTAMTVQLVALGGTAPYAWSVAQGALPAGLALASDGTLSGTPAEVGAFPFTAQVSDAAGAAASQELVLSSTRAGSLVVQTQALEDANVGVSYGGLVQASGGQSPYAWSLAGGALPAGLSLKQIGNDAQLVGRPTVPGVASLRLTCTDAAGATDSNTYLLSVLPAPLAMVTDGLPAGQPGASYEAELLSAAPSATWTLLAGALPPGLTLAKFGTITGSIDAMARVGEYGMVFRAEDAAGEVGYAGLTIDVGNLTRPAPAKASCATGGGAGWLALFAALLALGTKRTKRTLCTIGTLCTVCTLVTAPARAASGGYSMTQAPSTYAPLAVHAADLVNLGSDLVDPEDTGVSQLPFPSGFEFHYYGATFTALTVGAKGAASFSLDASTHLDVPGTGLLPTPNDAGNLVAPWYDDLYRCSPLDSTVGTSLLASQTLGAAPNRVFVVEWRNLQHAELAAATSSKKCNKGDPAISFQLRLYEGLDTVELDYGAVSEPDPTKPGEPFTATVGIQNADGTLGVAVPCSSAKGCQLAEFGGLTNQAITFTPAPDLAVSAVTAPAASRAGEPAQLSATVADVGLGPSPAATLHFTATTAGGAPIALGTAPVPALGAGASQVVQATLTLPAALAPGDYVVAATVDAVPGDDSPANDTAAAAATLLVLAPASDYSCSHVVPGAATAAAGATASADFEVTGSGKDADVPWALTLSSLRTATAADVSLAHGVVHVPAGVKVTVHAAGPLKDEASGAAVVPGRYFLGCVVNSPLGGATPLPEGNPFDDWAVAAAPLVVTGGALAIATSALPAAATGVPWDVGLVATGGDGTYLWTATGDLPPGLALTTAGALGGVPTAAGDYSLTVNVGSAGAAQSATLALHVAQPSLSLAIATNALPAAAWRTPYAARLVAFGGTPPYAWSLASGALPPGVALGPDGAVEGTPLAIGPMTFAAKVTDAKSDSATVTLALQVVDTGRPVVTPLALPDALVGTGYSGFLGAAGGTLPYLFKLLRVRRVPLGPLDGPETDTKEPPPGLTLDASSGALAGMPSAGGLYAMAVQVTDAAGLLDLDTVTLRVRFASGLSVLTSQLPPATVGAAYVADLHAAGGEGTLVWTLFSPAGGGLPEGIKLDPGGTLSGQPVAAGTRTFTLRVEDSRRRVDVRAVSLTVNAPAVTAATKGCASAGGAGWLTALVALALLARSRRARRTFGTVCTLCALGTLCTVGGGCAKPKDRCASVACASVETCDSSTGLCLCGGAGGRPCVQGEVCDPQEVACVPVDRCSATTCAGGAACDPADGTCKCGGAGGVMCGAGELCDPGTRVCSGVVGPCASVSCPGTLSCDPKDGACKCAGTACGAGQRCDGTACVPDNCAGTTCTGGETCDPTDGRCKCGGAGGPGCYADQMCDAQNRRCVAPDLCAGVRCAGAQSCDPADGTCRCGGPAGPVCGADQTCDLATFACLEGDRCAHVACPAGATCNAEDGLCRCGGSGAACPGDHVCLSGAVQACAARCDPLHPQCAAGAGCYYDDALSVGVCVRGGNAAEGAACNGLADCAPGLACVNASGVGTCHGYCLPPDGACLAGERCVPVADSPTTLGICAPG